MENIKAEKIVIIDEVEFVNLTPHDINLITEQGTITFESAVEKEFTARCSEERSLEKDIKGVIINQKNFGEVANLLEPKENRYYLVSNMVISACPNRCDLIAPDEIVRNENGQIVGCRSFSK